MKLLNPEEIKDLLIKTVEGEHDVCYAREEYKGGKYYYYLTIKTEEMEEHA